MDQVVVELLKDKIDKVDTKVDLMNEKIDVLLEWKWKLYGASAVLGIIGAGAFQIAKAILWNH